MEKNSKRENFGSRFVVIMAMAGSAIGLGNIWRFPYIAGEGGGAAFIIVYIISCIFLSMPIMMSEMIIGRRTQSNTFGAIKTLAPGGKWRWMGLITVISPLIILSYYSVVGGWSIEYLAKSISLDFIGVDERAASQEFSDFISSVWGPLACHTLFMASCAIVVLAGVQKGIGLFSKITMPILFVLIILIMIFSLSLPGAGEGVKYLVKPDFSKLTFKSVASAMGQSFFSLSLGVGTMLTYASYIKKDENLLNDGLCSAGFDFLFAMLAGFAIMPAVFAAGIAPGAGPGLVFETLPYIFSKMSVSMPFVSVAASILFFVAILVAAITSAISMLEVGVAYLVDEKNFSRKKAVLLLSFCCWALGCLCSLSFGPMKGFKIMGSPLFDFCDELTSDYLMSFGGLLFSIFVGWKMKKDDVYDEFTSSGRYSFNARCFPFVYFLIKYVAPIVVGVIFVTNLIF